MSVQKQSTIVIDRGMALHKMIRLITYALGGEVLYFNLRVILILWEMNSAIRNGLISQEKGTDGAINTPAVNGRWSIIKNSSMSS